MVKKTEPEPEMKSLYLRRQEETLEQQQERFTKNKLEVEHRGEMRLLKKKQELRELELKPPEIEKGSEKRIGIFPVLNRDAPVIEGVRGRGAKLQRDALERAVDSDNEGVEISEEGTPEIEPEQE